MTPTAPPTLAALQEAVTAAPSVVVRGGTTKSVAPRDRDDTLTIDMRSLSGICDYVPEECVLSALAGTPLREITGALAAHGQYLPFDPPFVAAGATIGGTVASGLSGAGRYRYGGVRDFLIGACSVDGEGRALRSGGKVVKNAAGFLLHHALVGSAGAFGVLAELTFKVFPAPEARATLRVTCSALDDALVCQRALAGGQFELDAVDFDAAGLMWIRLAGRAQSLRARVERVERTLTDTRALASLSRRTIEVLDEDEDRRVWAEACECAWAPPGASLVKVPVTPALVPAIAQLRRDRARIRYTCGGAMAWIAWEDEIEALADPLARMGLQALIVRGRSAGARIGAVPHNEFEERVRRVLDPRNRFRAAPASAC